MKMPAKSKIRAAEDIAERDRAAIRIMAERGCSMAEAWLILLERIPPEAGVQTGTAR